MLKLLLPRSEVERLAPSLKKEQGRRYREECLPRIDAFPEVRPLFEALARAGYGRALVTSCAKDELEHYLKLTGIAKLVDCVACGEDVDHEKPHPDLINLALRKTSHPAERAFMVGDTPFDAQAAKAAGVTSIGLSCGGFRKRELIKSGCSAVYRNPAQLHQELVTWIEASLSPAET
jgi:HAD superfamily hydrolase (TIGR01549 family)